MLSINYTERLNRCLKVMIKIEVIIEAEIPYHKDNENTL